MPHRPGGLQGRSIRAKEIERSLKMIERLLKRQLGLVAWWSHPWINVQVKGCGRVFGTQAWQQAVP